jgi:hypothetical protein
MTKSKGNARRSDYDSGHKAIVIISTRPITLL